MKRVEPVLGWSTIFGSLSGPIPHPGLSTMRSRRAWKLMKNGLSLDSDTASKLKSIPRWANSSPGPLLHEIVLDMNATLKPLGGPIPHPGSPYNPPYVYIYIYIYIYILHTYTHTHIYIHTCMHARMHACTHSFIHSTTHSFIYFFHSFIHRPKSPKHKNIRRIKRSC